MPVQELQIGKWTPDAGEHGNGGLVGCRGVIPTASGKYRSYDFMVLPTDDIGGEVYGAIVHIYRVTAAVAYLYVAIKESGGAGKIKRIALLAGDPDGAPPTDGIGTITDVTGTAIATMWPKGASFTTFGKYVLVAGDENYDPEFADSDAGSSFADVVPAGSNDRPACRYIAAAGTRILMAYIKHGSAAEQARVGSDDLVNPNLVWFSGDNDLTYWSTPTTPAGGTNNWDAGKLSEFVELVDDLGVITGLWVFDEGYGFIGKERGLYRFDYNSPGAVDFQLVTREIGVRSPHSGVAVPPDLYFLGTDWNFYKIGHGPLTPLSRGVFSKPLLNFDWIFQGTYNANDLSHAGSNFSPMPDIEGLFGTNDVSRYPVGAYDQGTNCVYWVYPSVLTATQRWLLACYSVDGEAWTVTDVTNCLNKQSGNEYIRLAMHWVTSYPGLGTRWKPAATPRYDTSPRDLFFGFEDSATTWSIGYFWPDQARTQPETSVFGYLLMDEPVFVWPFDITYGVQSSLHAVRFRFTRKLQAQSDAVDLTASVKVYTKESPGDLPNTQLAAMTTTIDLSDPPDPEGFYTIESRVGLYHSIELRLVNGSLRDGDPVGSLVSAPATILSELEGIDIKYVTRGRPRE